MAPRVLADRYRLIEPIGHGGMGTVWRAADGLLHREVAIKEMRASPELDPSKREELLARTMREARICAGLSTHPGIVTIHDVMQEDERPWIVMELVSGRGLDRVVAEEGPLPPRRTAGIGRQLFAALDTAHRHGVVHRDVKPANVMLLSDGHAMLSDFGIAVSDSEDKLTLTGRLPGSPGYVAPERLRHGVKSPAADVWAGRDPLLRGGRALGLRAHDHRVPADRAAGGHAGPPSARGGFETRPQRDASARSRPPVGRRRPGLGAGARGQRLGHRGPHTHPARRLGRARRGRLGFGTRPASAPCRDAGGDGPAGPDRGRRTGARPGWTRLLVSVVIGVVTLILAPLLVEFLASMLLGK
ncbi:serine/threonine-protein kinase [Streptomonospora wellingtoniae]|uniref:non-specific serine/threonine protein kinase n=1 Tax=Streptomonospora wellingtoniae TaxID=3075544 RepID=A0ABU2L161_9ACTN|nr:serine/threonine-protein kinase [Streptomonospora sp. DSM 45055]MDT0305297.1 serine/threonine-protein kinase [Streptomonospora sp. DSM 45055]